MKFICFFDRQWVLICSRLLAFTILIIGFTSCLDSDDPGPTENLLEVMQTDPDVALFLDALELANLTPILTQFSSVTVFAPTNTAFSAFLANEDATSAGDIPVDELTPFLLYQLLPGGLRSENFQSVYYFSANSFSPDSQSVILLANVNPSTNQITINDQATVIESNIEAQNGFIHKTDSVLTPPTAWELIRKNNNFSTFEQALIRLGLDDSLASESLITVFAPPNRAFDELLASLPGVDDLDDFSDEQLDRIIRFHLVPDNYISVELIIAELPTFLDGELLRVESISAGSGGLSTSVNLQTAVLLSDVQGTNGVIHVVNEVLDPDF